MRTYNNYEVAISNKELRTATDIKQHEAVRDIAALMMLNAAASEQLGRYNLLTEARRDEEAEKLFDSFHVQMTFGDYSAKVDLRSMDAYDCFCTFLSNLIYIADTHRE